MMFSLYYKKNDGLLPDGVSKAGRKFLFEALIHENITSYSEDDILVSQNGKPYFKDNKVFFNISHSENYLLAALSGAPVGVDIEEQRDSLLRVKKKILSDEEINGVLNLDKEDLAAYLLKKWVMLESYSKLTSLGLPQALKEPPVINKVSENLYKTEKIYFHLFPAADFAFCAASELKNPPKIIFID